MAQLKYDVAEIIFLFKIFLPSSIFGHGSVYSLVQNAAMSDDDGRIFTAKTMSIKVNQQNKIYLTTSFLN